MKKTIFPLRRYLLWFLVLLTADGFSVLFLWLADVRALKALIGSILMLSGLLFLGGLLLVTRQERKKQQLFARFLSDPDPVNEARLLDAVGSSERVALGLLSDVLHSQRNALSRMEEDLHDYEEYVEGWAHEAKTPLSLLTMLLDNHGEELPPPLRARLDYVRSQLQEDITQMLYYARLKSTTKDYRFQTVNFQEALEEVLADYAPLLEEKGFTVICPPGADLLFTDRRGLRFMLGQIISNSLKYSAADPVLTVSVTHEPLQTVLCIRDNGVGVSAHDLPYIFQKGFTGDSTDSRKKATGMGLYLTKKMADDLGLTVSADSRAAEGFAISIVFPEVR